MIWNQQDLDKIFHLTSRINAPTLNGSLNVLSVFAFISSWPHTHLEIHPNSPTTSKTIVTWLLWKKIKVMRINTRTISAPFVVEYLGKPVKIVTEKAKNFLKTTAIILRSVLKILKVLNWPIFRNSKNFTKPSHSNVLKEDGSAKTVYLSQASFPTKIYMNVYENHLSFIKDIQMYSKQYICNRCDKLFVEMRKLNKYQPNFHGTVEYAYPDAVYKCLYLRNWRKGVFVYVRRISVKSGLCVMILKSISGTFLKG